MVDSTESGFPTTLPSTIKAVFVDLDNTLYEHDSCHEKAMQSCFTLYQKNHQKELSWNRFETYYQIGRKAVQKQLLPQGVARSRLLYFQSMLEALEHPHAFNVALELDAEYMRAFLCSMSLDPNAQSFLKICKKTMRPVCIITNLTTAFQIKKLQKLKITPYIDYLVTSEEAGIEKPAPSFFHYAIKKVNRYQKVPLEAKNILVLGDNIENDINGAKKLGMPSQHITLT